MATRPLIDHGRCEAKRDCVRVCPYDVFEVRRMDGDDFTALGLLGKLRTTAQRLGHYLLELAPDKTSNSATLRLPFDKRLLAARLGCRQENLSRAFATLRRRSKCHRRGQAHLLGRNQRRFDFSIANQGPTALLL